MLCLTVFLVIRSKMNTNEFKSKVLSLSDRLFPMVARILGDNENARDAVQVIMMKLWDKRKQLGKHPNVGGFVFLTARNYCMDVLKKKKPEIDDLELRIHFLESGKTVLEQLEQKELNDLVKKVIESLPKQQREVIILRELDGLEFKEITKITKLKVEHIRVLLSRARKTVSIELNKIYSYEQGEI